MGLIILSKRTGCKYCAQLDMFLNLAMGGQFNDKFEKVLDDDPLYHKLVEEYDLMAMPVIINLETKEQVSGFDATETLRMLS